MDTQAAPRAEPHRSEHRVEFARSSTDRMLFGVCGGAARRYGVDVYVVRIALLLLTLTGGLGVVLYIVGFALSGPPEEVPTERDVEPGVVSARTLAVAAATGGLLMTARNIGLWPGDAIMVPAIIVAAGSALVWYHGRESHPEGDPLERVLQGRATPLRALGGVALAMAGLVALVARGVRISQLPAALAALAMALAGAAVLVGPYIGRLTTQLRDEERARIRDQERNDMAAHLHDSVLQTLALMQRAASDPRRMVMLARRQERELRSWLYDANAGTEVGSLSARAEGIAAEVELDHGMPVDLVVVGDIEVTPAVDALLLAVREATVNAAKHAQADLVSVYIEVEANTVTAFVRDKGAGFTVAEIGDDRRGIAMSIRDRIERVGGRASLGDGAGGGHGVGVGGAEMTARVRVFVVDDHALFRSGVKAEIGDAVDIVGDVGTVDEAIIAIRATKPDVVLLDVHLPNGGGRAILEGLADGLPDTKCLALSVSDAADDVIGVIRAGARGYVTKTITREELLDAIRRVHAGDAVFSPRLAGFVLDAFAGTAPVTSDPEMDRLTQREQEVLRLIARGYTYKEVATRIHVSVKTVETHVSSVLRKLQLSNRHELTAWATDRRLL